MHPVDVQVGKNIRSSRWLKGMNQHELAGQIGVTFQQLQKYESGVNRVSASRLWEIARALNVAIECLFAGTEADEADETQESGANRQIFDDRESVDLILSYRAIPPNQRRRLFDLAQVMADIARQPAAPIHNASAN